MDRLLNILNLPDFNALVYGQSRMFKNIRSVKEREFIQASFGSSANAAAAPVEYV